MVMTVLKTVLSAEQDLVKVQGLSNTEVLIPIYISFPIIPMLIQTIQFLKLTFISIKYILVLSSCLCL